MNGAVFERKESKYNKNVIFWIDQKERKHKCIVVHCNNLDDPLPFKIMYTDKTLLF